MSARELVDLEFWFYNLDNGRPHSVVQHELAAIASTRPAFIGACEATGYRFEPLPGLVLARDRSTPARANIASWVRRDLAGPTGEQRWLDLSTTWPRTDRGGIHEPRSFQRRHVGRIPVFTAHQVPPHIDLTDVGHQEGVDALAGAMDPTRTSEWQERPREQQEQARQRPRVLLWDANRRPGEPGPGPSLLARQIGGRTVGHRIDGAVVRGDCKASAVDYPDRVAGVELLSNHGHAFRFTLTVDRRWIDTTKEHR